MYFMLHVTYHKYLFVQKISSTVVIQIYIGYIIFKRITPLRAEI